MSAILSYLLIPFILFIIVLNILIRIKIIKRYNQLKDKNVDLQGKLWFSRKEIENNYAHDPQLAKDLMAFSSALRNLIILAVAGLTAIILIFFIIYFNRT